MHPSPELVRKSAETILRDLCELDPETLTFDGANFEWRIHTSASVGLQFVAPWVSDNDEGYKHYLGHLTIRNINCAVLFDRDIDVDDTAYRIKFDELRLEIADAIAAAEAGATPGLEPLYLAQARDRREAVTVQQALLFPRLQSLGIDESTGRWLDGDFIIGGARLTAVRNLIGDTIVNVSVVGAPVEYFLRSIFGFDGLLSSIPIDDQQVALLEAITAAQEAHKRFIDPSFVIPEPTNRYMVSDFGDTYADADEMAAWLNKRDAEGYANPVYLPVSNTVRVIMTRAPKPGEDSLP